MTNLGAVAAGVFILALILFLVLRIKLGERRQESQVVRGRFYKDPECKVCDNGYFYVREHTNEPFHLQQCAYCLELAVQRRFPGTKNVQQYTIEEMRDILRG